MLLAPRHNGFDLPVHEAGTPVVASRQLHRIGEPQNQWRDNDSVLRLINPYLDLEATQSAPPDLAELLERTDEELAEVAEMCEATVVDHEWALLHDPDGDHLDFHPRGSISELIPPEHVLVAEVDIIKGAVTLYSDFAEERHPDIYKTVTDGVCRYESKGSGWILTDMWLPQFVVTEGSSPDTHQVTLVDIEPKIEFVD